MNVNKKAIIGLLISLGAASVLLLQHASAESEEQTPQPTSQGLISGNLDQSGNISDRSLNTDRQHRPSSPPKTNHLSKLPQEKAIDVPAAIPATLTEDAEVIIVSGYEPQGGLDKTRVKIDRPGQNVLLVLSSYETVNWHVEVTPKTQLNGILVSSYEDEATVSTTDSSTIYRTSLPFADKLESPGFVHLLQELNTLFGIETISAYRGSYTLAKTFSLSQPDPVNSNLTLEGPSTQAAPIDFSFNLFKDDFSAVPWTLNGPIDGVNPNVMLEKTFTLSPDEKTIYEVRDGLFYVIDKETQNTKRIALPSDFPEFSWVMALAYDSRREIVSIVTLGGEGYFYRFNAKNNQWLDFKSVNQIDFYALTYDASQDRYIGIARHWKGSSDALALTEISNSGDILSTKSVTDQLPSFDRFNELENGPPSKIDVFAQGKHIGLVQYKGDQYFNLDNQVQAIWYFDETQGTGKLTYKAR